jgi:hypothetical protein
VDYADAAPNSTLQASWSVNGTPLSALVSPPTPVSAPSGTLTLAGPTVGSLGALERGAYRVTIRSDGGPVLAQAEVTRACSASVALLGFTSTASPPPDAPPPALVPAGGVITGCGADPYITAYYREDVPTGEVFGIAFTFPDEPEPGGLLYRGVGGGAIRKAGVYHVDDQGHPSAAEDGLYLFEWSHGALSLLSASVTRDC